MVPNTWGLYVTDGPAERAKIAQTLRALHSVPGFSEFHTTTTRAPVRHLLTIEFKPAVYNDPARAMLEKDKAIYMLKRLWGNALSCNPIRMPAPAMGIRGH